VRPSAATHFQVAVPASVTAGVTFKFTVTALDKFNNQVTAYAGSVHFKSTDRKAKLPGNSALTGGTRTFSAKLRTKGTQTIKAADAVLPLIKGSSDAVTVELQ
jgi:hypothetical protein